MCLCTTSIRHTFIDAQQKQNRTKRMKQQKEHPRLSQRCEIKMLFTNESCIHEMFERISNAAFCVSKGHFSLIVTAEKKNEKHFSLNLGNFTEK